MRAQGRHVNPQRGLSLVELLIALAVGIFLVAGSIQLLVSSGQVYRSMDASARVQENARFSLATMARDIRTAGYLGCRSLGDGVDADYTADGFSDSGDHNMNGAPVGLIGYEDGADNGKSVLAWDAFFTALFAASDITRVDGTDVIQVLYANGEGTTLATSMTASSDELDLASNPDALDENDVAAITDCSTVGVFSVASDSEDDAAMEHDGLNKAYESGARVFPLEARAFFVGTHTDADNVCNQSPCLYRLSLGGGSPEPLVNGVENLQVMYGEDTGSDGLIDVYRKADEVVDWTRVYSLRMGLLFASDVEVTHDEQQYIFSDPGDGDAVTLAGDRRYRAPYWTTVALRNMMP